VGYIRNYNVLWLIANRVVSTFSVGRKNVRVYVCLHIFLYLWMHVSIGNHGNSTVWVQKKISQKYNLVADHETQYSRKNIWIKMCWCKIKIVPKIRPTDRSNQIEIRIIILIILHLLFVHLFYLYREHARLQLRMAWMLGNHFRIILLQIPSSDIFGNSLEWKS